MAELKSKPGLLHITIRTSPGLNLPQRWFLTGIWRHLGKSPGNTKIPPLFKAMVAHLSLIHTHLVPHTAPKKALPGQCGLPWVS